MPDAFRMQTEYPEGIGNQTLENRTLLWTWHFFSLPMMTSIRKKHRLNWFNSPWAGFYRMSLNMHVIKDRLGLRYRECSILGSVVCVLKIVFLKVYFWDSCSEQCYVVGVVYFPAWINIFVAVLNTWLLNWMHLFTQIVHQKLSKLLFESTDEISILY